MNKRTLWASPASIIMFAIIFGIDIFAWYTIYAQGSICPHDACFFFLNAHPGAVLLVFGDGPRILIDSGIGDETASALHAILGGSEGIDLAFANGPAQIHAGGYPSIVSEFTVGALVINGRDPNASDSMQWNGLTQTLAKKKIPKITVGAGDRFIFKNSMAEIKIVAPNDDFKKSPAPHDATLIEAITTDGMRVMIASDASARALKFLKATPSPTILQLFSSEDPSSTIESVMMAYPRILVLQSDIKDTAHLRSLSKFLERISAAPRIFDVFQQGAIELWNDHGVISVKRGV